MQLTGLYIAARCLRSDLNCNSTKENKMSNAPVDKLKTFVKEIKYEIFSNRAIELLVKQILEKPMQYKWSVQGLGFMRLYLSDTLRLHIWDSRLQYANVSIMHNHPWDFYSYIVSGNIHNVRYDRVHEHVPVDDVTMVAEYWKATLHCGEGNCEMFNREMVKMQAGEIEHYEKGDWYEQRANEVHATFPDDSTITLVHRDFVKQDREHADVYWPVNASWGTAEPRPASEEEVRMVTKSALTMLNPYIQPGA
jgi:hypothetical protein